MCFLSEINCLCTFRPKLEVNASFAILYHPNEIHRKSNTGLLISSTIAGTKSFIWDRCNPPVDFLELIANKNVKPWLIFPGSARNKPTANSEDEEQTGNQRQNLFILIDGTWREASKMVRRSPVLFNLSRIELQIDESSQYQLRRNQSINLLNVC